MVKNIFKSKLAHPDKEIRIKAISKLRSASKLINVIKEDKQLECKMAALEKLNSVQALMTIYDYIDSYKKQQLTDLLKEKFLKFIGRTNNRIILTDIKSNISWAAVSYAARDKLVELTKSISDQDELFRIVKSESLYWVYREAIFGINDENFLLHIVSETKETGSQSKRELAIEKLIKIIQDTKDQVKLINYVETISIPKVRAAAISNIKDQEIIEKHALSDKDNQVRINAIKKLKDKNIVLKILDDANDNIKAEGLKLIFDQSVLVNYALNDTCKKIRISAIQNITDESFLTNIVFNEKDYEIRCAAVKNISNQKTLERLAIEDNDWLVRLNAVEKVDNQDVLEKYLIKDGDDPHSAEEVIERVYNQELLFSFVKKHRNKSIRLMAVKNITDDFILGEIAKKHAISGNQMGYEIKTSKCIYLSNKFVSTVISKITDPLILQDIVFNSKNKACKREAAHKISEQQILASIYVKCKDDSIRDIVKNNFQGQTAYNYIAINAKSPEDRIFAIDNIDNQDTLFEIIKNEKVKSICLEAIKKLSDSEILFHIFKNNKDWDICLSALRNITNQEILSDFALNHLSSIVRTIAIKKLKVKSIIYKIAKLEQDDSVRQIALERLEILKEK